MADTEETTSTPPTGRAFVSDGKGLTLIEQVPWSSRQLQAALSVAMAHERFITEGAFAVVYGRHRGAYTARRIGSLDAHTPVVLKVVSCEGHWIAVGPTGTGPREVFPDGDSQPWDGPVPVEALA